MKLIGGLLALGVALIGSGFWTIQHAASADEKTGAVMPFVIGGSLAFVGLVLAVLRVFAGA